MALAEGTLHATAHQTIRQDAPFKKNGKSNRIKLSTHKILPLLFSFAKNPKFHLNPPFAKSPLSYLRFKTALKKLPSKMSPKTINKIRPWRFVFVFIFSSVSFSRGFLQWLYLACSEEGQRRGEFSVDCHWRRNLKIENSRGRFFENDFSRLTMTHSRLVLSYRPLFSTPAISLGDRDATRPLRQNFLSIHEQGFYNLG